MSIMIIQRLQEAGLVTAETRAGHRFDFADVERVEFDRVQVGPIEFIQSNETASILVDSDLTMWVLGGPEDGAVKVAVRIGPRAKPDADLADGIRRIVAVLTDVAGEVEVEDLFGIFTDEDPDEDPDEDETEEVTS